MPTKAEIHARANEILFNEGWGTDCVTDRDFSDVGGGGMIGRAVAQAKRQLEEEQMGHIEHNHDAKGIYPDCPGCGTVLDQLANQIEVKVLAAEFVEQKDLSVCFDAGIDGLQHIPVGKRIFVECEVTNKDEGRVVLTPRVVNAYEMEDENY